jgi:hypothetical protein
MIGMLAMVGVSILMIALGNLAFWLLENPRRKALPPAELPPARILKSGDHE